MIFLKYIKYLLIIYYKFINIYFIRKKEAAKIEQLKHLTIRSFFSKIKGTRSSELLKVEKLYQNTCKQYEQAKKALDVNKSLWDESKKELLECQTNNKNYNRYKNELEELLQEVFDGPTPNFPQEDALEQQVTKLFLNFTQLSQVIHQCELAKDDLKNAHMYLVNFFKGNETVRDYASIWDLSPTSVIKTLKEIEKHDDLTILSDAKDYVKQANEKIQHARVLLTKKTNLTSNKIERLEELFESIVDNQEIRYKEGLRKIDSNLEKELGETRIWLGEEIQSLKQDYIKQEKELAIYKTKLFEERQRILNLWVVNLDDSVKKRMIENSSARGRKRNKSKISIGKDDENDSNWFDTSGITCAADLAVRNNTISRNASVKSATTLFNKDLDTLKVGSCPASNGFYTLNNINQYMGSTPTLDYYHDPIHSSLPRWPMNQSNSLFTNQDNINIPSLDISMLNMKAHSDIIRNYNVRLSDTQSQDDQSAKKSNVSQSPSNTLDNSSRSRSHSHSHGVSKKTSNNSSLKLSKRNSKKSIPTRSSTKNSHSSNQFGHATTSAININGVHPASVEYGLPNIINNSLTNPPSTPTSIYNQTVIPRISTGNSNYMYNRYSMDQYALQSAYLHQYYPYSTSANDLTTNTLFNPMSFASSYMANNAINTPLATNTTATTTTSTVPTNDVNYNAMSGTSTIQRSRSAIVSHVMDKPLNRAVVNDTINLNIPYSPISGNSKPPNIAELQQSPMFPFPQRSRSVSAPYSKKEKEKNPIKISFSFRKKKNNNSNNIHSSNVGIMYDPTKPVKRNAKLSFSKHPKINLKDVTGKTSVIVDEEKDNKQSIDVVQANFEEEKDDKKSNDVNQEISEEENDETSSSSSTSSSYTSSSSTSTSSSSSEDSSDDSSDASSGENASISSRSSNSESEENTDDSDNDSSNEEEEVEEKNEEKKEKVDEKEESLIEHKFNKYTENVKPVITDRIDSKNINTKLLNVENLMAISSTPSVQ